MPPPTSSICYQLRNYEKNKSWLEKVSHIRYLDLAIVFYYPIPGSDGKRAAFITNENLAEWNLTIDQIETFASQNTPISQPLFFHTLDTLLQELSEEYGIPVVLTEDPLPMYILSNKEKFLGAAAILYPGALKKISQQLKDNFYILPSSVHECILVPAHQIDSGKYLAEIVREVNETEISEEEFLSDYVYYYDGREDSICPLLENE